MRISRIHITNFRCLRDLAMSLEDLTVLVGANSTGKSSVLHALAWFFDGGELDREDVSGHQDDLQVSVSATFTDFDDQDREALGSYVMKDEATFWRTWRAGVGDKLTGMGRAYPPFAAVRLHAAATPKRAAYNDLRQSQPALGLPTVRSAREVDEALVAWEAEHDAELSDERIDATHLFGFTGQARLAGRMDFVLIPAVSDTDTEATDARGTMLRQLLDRALGEQGNMRARLTELERDVNQQIFEIMTEDGGAALDQLSESVTRRLAEFVPDREITLMTQPPRITTPRLSVALRVQDGNLDTAVSHQGHGFQRALLIAMVQQLADEQGGIARNGDGGSDELGDLSLFPDADPSSHGDPALADITTRPSPPALFLAIEEPELYQHPVQARHFASSLASLAASTDATVQVAYATHSEHFVDSRAYQRLRRFSRLSGAEWPESAVTQATIEGVAERVAGLFDAQQIALRVRMTLRRKLAEAVFAKAVLLVEGETDAGLLQGIADRSRGLDAIGIAVVHCHGKTQMMIPRAILQALGVPTYVVFDGDSGLAERMRTMGKPETDIARAVAKNGEENRTILQLLDAEPTPQPLTAVTHGYTVFADNLESELLGWEGFGAAVTETMLAQGGWTTKSYDIYREAAATTHARPPRIFEELLNRLEAVGA